MAEVHLSLINYGKAFTSLLTSQGLIALFLECADFKQNFSKNFSDNCVYFMSLKRTNGLLLSRKELLK